MVTGIKHLDELLCSVIQASHTSLTHPSHTPPCCLEDWLPRARKKAPQLFRRNEKNPSLIAVILFPLPLLTLCLGWLGSWVRRAGKCSPAGRCPVQRVVLSKSVPCGSSCGVPGGGSSRVPDSEGTFIGGRGAVQHPGTGPARSVTSILSPSWRLWVLGSPSGLRWSLYSTGWGGGLYPGQASLSWVWNVPSQVVTSLEARPWCCFTCLEMIIFFVVNKGQESRFYEWWKDPDLKCFQKSPLRIGFLFCFVFCAHSSVEVLRTRGKITEYCVRANNLRRNHSSEAICTSTCLLLFFNLRIKFFKWRDVPKNKQKRCAVTQVTLWFVERMKVIYIYIYIYTLLEKSSSTETLKWKGEGFFQSSSVLKGERCYSFFFLFVLNDSFQEKKGRPQNSVSVCVLSGFI